MEAAFSFLLGALIGGLVGVFIMVLVVAGRDDDDDPG